jgi:prepilin-type N-terminal cleavage/methylation domain-containing protein
MTAALRRRLADESGLTLIELVTVLAILSVVLSGIMVLFVSGIRAEADMNERFQAEQEARIALSRLRREIRTACWTNATATAAPSATLGYCGDPSHLTSVTSQVTWCVSSLGPQRYALYRQDGSTCSSATGAKRADRLISNAVFALAQNPSDVRPKLRVSLNVDSNPTTSGGSYLLDDAIMLRNWRS